MLVVIDVGEPSLNIWNTFGNSDVSLGIVNHKNRLSENNRAQVLSWYKLRHDVFGLHPDQDHSVWIAFISGASGKAKSIDEFHVDQEALRPGLEKRIKLTDPGGSKLFERLEGMRCFQLCESDLSLHVEFRALLESFNQSPVDCEQGLCV